MLIWCEMMGAHLEGMFWGEDIEHEIWMGKEGSSRKIWVGEENRHEEE